MHRRAMPLVVFAALAACDKSTPAPTAAPAETAQAPAADPVPEYWEGMVALPNQTTLEFFVHFTPGGEHAGTIDIPMQGARALPLQDVGFEGDRMSFALAPPIDARWTCTREGDTARCTLAQHGLELEGEMDAIDAEEFADATKLERPQTPQPPFPYRSEEVAYPNEAAGNELAGTLTLPEGDGPHPVVLLISGSGAQDRDETIFEHKPFWVLADHLTRAGIAVLRVDDRGVGGSTGDIETSTSEDFASDVLAGVAYLAGRKDIDAEHIGLIGHSEGGLIAPMAAVKSKQVAFVVLLAGPGVPGRDILDHQGRLIAEKSGAGPDLIENDSKQRKEMFRILDENPEDEQARQKLTAFYRAQLEELPEDKRQQLGDLDKVAEAQVRSVASPWFRFFLSYDPRPTLRKLKIPVLAVTGQKDLQVDPEQNLPEIRKALKKARNRDVTIETLPGLNHLFQSAERGTPDEYIRIEETFDPKALTTISDWVVAHSRK